MSNHVQIFDTTLRDGEQCPGASMTIDRKIIVARQLERLGIDVIEAGFPVISKGDFEAVHRIASEITSSKIAGLARCVEKDIIECARALQPAGDRAHLHVVLATSKLHREAKLNKSCGQIIKMAVDSVMLAKTLAPHVEFSAEDASRTEHSFLAEITEAVIAAGATVVNIPDTVGYTTPIEFYNLISYLKQHVPNVDDSILSVHCHDDLGLAVANSLAAVQAGARQVEGSINGIGERAGNMALEEFIMAVKTRHDQFGDVQTRINCKEIVPTSRIVAEMSGLPVHCTKAVVGANAFAHGSGIHQDGVLKNRQTYEIMDPEEIGWGATELPLTKHSGRHAVKARLESIGYRLTEGQLTEFFPIFKDAGDNRKFVDDNELSRLALQFITPKTREKAGVPI